MSAESSIDISTTSFARILIDCVKRWDHLTNIILVTFAATSIAFVVDEARASDHSLLGSTCICLLGAAAQGGVFCIATELIGAVVGEKWAAIINVVFGNVPEIFFLGIAYYNDQSDTVMPTLLSSVASNSVLLLGVVILTLCWKSVVLESPVSRLAAAYYFACTSVLAGLLLASSFIRHRGGQITILAAGTGLFLGFMTTRSLSKRLDLRLTLAKLRDQDEETVAVAAATTAGEEEHPPLIKDLRTRQGGTSIICATSLVLFAGATVAAYYMQNRLIQTIQHSEHFSAHKNGIYWIFGILGNIPEHLSAVLLAFRGSEKSVLQIPIDSSLIVLGLLIPLANIIAVSLGQHFSSVDNYFNVYVLFGSVGFLGLLSIGKWKQTSVGISALGTTGFFVAFALTFTSLGTK